MDRPILVRETRKLEREVRRLHGPVALLMLVSRDPSVDDEWNIIVSAKGLNRLGWAGDIREIVALLRRVMTPEVWPRIDRVTVLRTDDPFVAAVSSAFRTQASEIDLNSYHIAGFDLAKAVLLTSKKVAA